MTRVLEKQNKQDISSNGSSFGSPHFGTVLSITAGLAGEYWRLSLVSDLNDPGFRRTLKELTRHCTEPNPFFSLPILEPAIPNLSHGKLRFLCLTRHDAVSTELKFFLPVEIREPRLFGKRIIRSWTHSYGPLGTPLLTDNNTDETLKTLSNCLTLVSDDRFDALVIDNLPKKSTFSTSLFENPQLANRLTRYATFTRAGFSSKARLKTLLDMVSGKRKQKLAAARRKLEKVGKVEFSTWADKDHILRALADQLQLENEGWKGRQGTSVKSDPKLQAFMETAVQSLASSKKCKIHTLSVNGIPVASLLMIQSDGHYYPWKVAYDEAFGQYSVGNQLVSYTNEILGQTPSFRSLDSLASELNQTAYRFWPDSQEYSSMVIGFGPNAAETALAIAEHQRQLSRLKRTIKSLLGRSL